MKILCKCGCGNLREELDKKGRKRSFIYGHSSEEYKLKMRLINLGNEHNLGNKHSEETKRLYSQQRKGKHFSEKIKKERSDLFKKLYLEGKIKSQWKGKKFSETHKANLSKSIKEAKMKSPSPIKGGHLSEKHKHNISLALIGKEKSEEHKKNMSLSQKGKLGEKNSFYGKTHSEETIKTLSEKAKLRIGEKSSNWQGGKSCEPYSFDFNNRFKRKIKERDGCCMVCNMSFEDIHLLKRRIAVHHIDYDKKNSMPQNCLSLCNPCHMKTNGNRNQWKVFFYSLLNERYGYQYTEDQKIILDFTNNNEG